MRFCIYPFNTMPVQRSSSMPSPIDIDLGTTSVRLEERSFTRA
jgi:hypothetical protein